MVAVFTLIIEYWIIAPIKNRNKIDDSDRKNEKNKFIQQEEQINRVDIAQATFNEKHSKIQQSNQTTHQDFPSLVEKNNNPENNLPKMPSPIFSILFITAGYIAGIMGVTETTNWLTYLGIALIALGFVTIFRRNKFYRDVYKPALLEAQKRKQRF